MNAVEAIRISLEMAEQVALGYVEDLTDQELMLRPHPESNHLNWQLGHLVSSEHEMLAPLYPEAYAPLPTGFADSYAKSQIGLDELSAFASKSELMETYRTIRATTLRLLDGCDDEELSESTGIEYAPTKGALFSIQGSHWLMHCGQWVIVRRMLGKPIMM